MANQSWWSTARPGAGFDVDPISMSASASCSGPPGLAQAHAAGGGFNWTHACDVFDAKSSSCDESPVSLSSSSVTFQDIQHPPHASAQPVLVVDAAPQALDFGLSSPAVEWSAQTNFFGSGSGSAVARTESSFQALFQEDTSLGPLNSMSRPSFLHDNIHGLSSDVAMNSGPLLSAPAPAPLQLQQGRLEPIKNLKYSNYSVNYRGDLDESLPSFVRGLPPYASATEVHSSQSVLQNENPGYCNNLISKANSGIGSCFPALDKKIGSAQATKKPRLGTTSSLPTFKVRKEKLGDRITALQQLVSPFGKTDTASVLHESIEYIKFLHDQVRVSSAPYLKAGQQMPQIKGLDKSKECEGQEQDLKSRGLCLVPISSTFAVANDIPTDLWTSTFVGAFR